MKTRLVLFQPDERVATHSSSFVWRDTTGEDVVTSDVASKLGDDTRKHAIGSAEEDGKRRRW